MTKLYVGNLPYNMNDEGLAAAFAEYGPVASAVIIMDKRTGRSKGFGFVELEDDAKAKEAIEKMNGAEIEGRNAIVSEARPMKERE